MSVHCPRHTCTQHSLYDQFQTTRTSVSAGKRKLKIQEALPGGREGKGEGHVARLNFKTSRVVGVYKCLSLIVGFAVTVAIWPREVVSCRDFILRAVATFWAMSLVGIYPGRASYSRSVGRRRRQ